MEQGGGSSIGGIPGAGQNILDAGAQAYYPALGPPCSFQLLPHQFYCPQPPYPPVPPVPPPMVVPMLPPAAFAEQPGFSFSMPMPSAPTAVDGPASRAVVLSLVPPQTPEAEVARAMAPFGAVRAVESSALASEGVAAVHFYDLRAAEAAVAAVRDQHIRQQCRLRQLYAAGTPMWPPPPLPGWDWPHDDNRGLVLGNAVWAHFAAANTLPDDGASRGCLVVLNSLPGVSLFDFRQTFQAFGDVKDVRESAQRPSIKFVEFFDTRDAARALRSLNGKNLFGCRLNIEFTRSSSDPGNRRRSCVPHPPTPTILPRLQATWRPTSTPVHPPQASSSSSSGTSKAREGVVLLRRTKSTAGDHSKGANAGTSHDRKPKGGKTNAVVVTTSAASASPSSSSSSVTASVKQGEKAARNWRGHKSGWEAHFLFREPDATVAIDDTQEPASVKDTRTTVMIRNIPNKYSQKLLLNMLDNHCILSNQQIEASEGEEGQPLSSYDFLYLPIDFNNKCNVGYGFVNLTSPEAAVRLYKAFHKQPWEVYNSRKICQITYARVQGLEALKDHFKNSKFPCDSDEYLPVVFSPPRDGKQLTEPIILVGRSPTAPSSESGTSSPPKSRAPSVDPLALELMAPPSSSGDGASSTTVSTHAPSDRADEDRDGSDDDDDDDGGLGEELQRLGYTS